VELQSGEQIHVVYLFMYGGTSIVVYLASLMIDLGADGAGLVIYLIAAIPCVVLVVSLIPVRSVMGSLVGYDILVVAGSLEKLVIFLIDDSLLLTTDLIAAVAGIVLIVCLVETLIPAISVIGPLERGIILVIVVSL
jgi:hypothetical protein